MKDNNIKNIVVSHYIKEIIEKINNKEGYNTCLLVRIIYIKNGICITCNCKEVCFQPYNLRRSLI